MFFSHFARGESAGAHRARKSSPHHWGVGEDFAFTLWKSLDSCPSFGSLGFTHLQTEDLGEGGRHHKI